MQDHIETINYAVNIGGDRVNDVKLVDNVFNDFDIITIFKIVNVMMITVNVQK